MTRITWKEYTPERYLFEILKQYLNSIYVQNLISIRSEDLFLYEEVTIRERFVQVLLDVVRTTRMTTSVLVIVNKDRKVDEVDD